MYKIKEVDSNYNNSDTDNKHSINGVIIAAQR